MLVRVADAREAAQAAAAGIDAVEVAIDPQDATSLALAGAVRDAFPGLLRLQAATIDTGTIEAAATLRADEIAASHVATARTAAGPKSVAVLAGAAADAVTGLRGRVDAVMLDTGEARLIDRTGIAALDVFAGACRAETLGFGLAGGLEAPDIARLLLLQPDVLAFDTAVRLRHDAHGPLDPAALEAMRALVPRDPKRGGRARIAKVIDRIFVRDFEVALAIGAYQAEHGKSQRVRFSITADIVREPGPPRDMRDVFSYDVIIETIRVLSERAHVTFVETLAEEVAASLLTHSEVVAVTVKVEKLDVIRGAVGIEIRRRHDTP